MRGRGVLVAVLLAALLPACGAGLIYTHVTVPLQQDMDATPTQPAEGQSDWKTLQVSLIARIDWNSAALADAARQAGIERIDYADLEILSVFFGVWQQRTAHVHGRGPGPAAAAAPAGTNGTKESPP